MCIIRVEFWRFFDTREISLYKCESWVQVNDFQKVLCFTFFECFVTKENEKTKKDLQGFKSAK